MRVDIAYLFFAVFIPCRRGRGSEWGTRFRLPPFDIYTECFYSFLLWNTFINFSWTIPYNISLYKAYFIWKWPGVWPWMAYLHLGSRFIINEYNILLSPMISNLKLLKFLEIFIRNCYYLFCFHSKHEMEKLIVWTFTQIQAYTEKSY